MMCRVRVSGLIVGLLLLIVPVQAQDPARTITDKVRDRIMEALWDGETSLDLSRMGMTELPPEIGLLREVISLNIGYNELTELPPEIGNMVALRRLYAHNNRLTTIPPELGNIESLVYLQLQHNELASLPPEITESSTLTFVNVEGNPMSRGGSVILTPDRPSQPDFLASLDLRMVSGNVLLLIGVVGALYAWRGAGVFVRKSAAPKNKTVAQVPVEADLSEPVPLLSLLSDYPPPSE
jgi:Leucine-rich repeat (LRR) protein